MVNLIEKDENDNLIYNTGTDEAPKWEKIGKRLKKYNLWGAIILPTDEKPAAYFTFAFQVPRKITVAGGIKDGISSYYVLDELSAKLSEGFEGKLKEFCRKYYIDHFLAEPGNDLLLNQLRKSAELKFQVIDEVEAAQDNINLTIDAWSEHRNEDDKAVLNIRKDCNLFFEGHQPAKRAIRNLLIYFGKYEGKPLKMPKIGDGGGYPNITYE